MESDTQLDLPTLNYAWLDTKVPNGFWDVRKNRVAYLRWLGRELGFSKPTDWYAVRTRHFLDRRGGTLLTRYYQSSVLAAVQELYPKYKFQPWRLGKTPAHFWRSKSNRRAFMRALAQEQGIESSEQWYTITPDDFRTVGGAGLLNNYFHGSVLEAVRDYQPRVDWKPWLFPKVPHGYWDDPRNRKKYYQWLARQYGFRRPEDWNELTLDRIHGTRTKSLLEAFGGSLTNLVDDIVTLLDEK